MSETRPLDSFKILMATPHSYPTIHKEWFAMYEELQKPVGMRLYMDSNLPLSVNRNNAVKKALESDCEYVFFVDHDNILPPDTLVRLLEYNLPCVGCLYFERKYPYLPLIYTFEDDHCTIRIEHGYSKGLIRCDVIGLGCSLIKTEVFKQLGEDDWFCYNYKGQHWGTEDIAFFHKLQDHRVPVYIDTINTVGHLSAYIIDEGDWLYHKDAYLTQVNRRAKEMGTHAVFLDRNKDRFERSPSHEPKDS